jgi:NitT/TauT family transport system substrate-binding protein
MIGRRHFLTGSAAVVTTIAAHRGGLAAAAEPPPETTRVRLGAVPSICLSPQYVAEELLRAEGFIDIRYPPVSGGVPGAKEMGAGDADIAMNMAAPLVVALDVGTPIVVLAGVHVGCFELIATDRVRTIKDLKGKTVAVFGLESAQHVFLASMAALVGLDPRKDITWVTHPSNEAKQLLAEGKIDAFLGFPPDPQDLRARKIGHVVVNSATDRPWSQYFCCMVVANREFVARHPVATKRALRAILKGDQVCALDPARAARAYRDRGFDVPEHLVLQALKEVPFGRWRAYDPTDTLRFYALRLQEAGMIKASPQKILAHGTDWRFLNELKRELKS